MEEQSDQVVSLPTPAGAAEERMLRADLVREMVARAQRAEGAKRIARELGVDRKTVKRWLRLGAWQPRRHQRRPLPIDGFFKFIEQRGPEVGCVPAAAARRYRDCHGRSKPPLSFLIYLQALHQNLPELSSAHFAAGVRLMAIHVLLSNLTDEGRKTLKKHSTKQDSHGGAPLR